MATQLHIPSPCTKNWADMTPVRQSCRHCAVCEKQIIDFTLKTDAEILEHLRRSGNLCGRFRPDQLERPLLTARTAKRGGLSAIAASFAAVLAAQQPTESRTSASPATEQVFSPWQQQVPGQVKQDDLVEKDSMRTISGKVTNEAGKPIMGASIRFAETRFGAVSDPDGMFHLKIPLDTLQTNPLVLQIRYPDYSEKTVMLPERTRIEDLSLVPAQTQMQPVETTTVIMGLTFVEETPNPKPRKRSFFHQLFH